MKMETVYEKLKELQLLAWQDDDRMDQGTLFHMQDILAEFILEVANDCGKISDLMITFPWLYK